MDCRIISFANYNSPIKTFNSSGETWIATQDCCISGLMGNIGSNAAVITVNNVNVAACASGVGVQQNNNTIGVNIYM